MSGGEGDLTKDPLRFLYPAGTALFKCHHSDSPFSQSTSPSLSYSPRSLPAAGDAGGSEVECHHTQWTYGRSVGGVLLYRYHSFPLGEVWLGKRGVVLLHLHPPALSSVPVEGR